VSRLAPLTRSIDAIGLSRNRVAADEPIGCIRRNDESTEISSEI
jgi:hypothetical protein